MWNNQGDSYGDQGGGYMTGNFSSPQASQGGQKRQRAQSIVPCTVAQILTATQADDRFILDNMELHQVTIVGIVRSVKQTPTRMDYEIDDMSGPFISVRQFIDSEDNEMEDKNTVMRENTYVRACGHISSFAGKRSLVAFRMLPIMDMNELTGHLLEVIKAHIMLTKGQAVKGTSTITGNNMSMDTGGASTYMGAQGDGMNGLTNTQKQVSLVIKSSDSEQGVSVTTICQQLRGIPEKAIREALDFLSGEGHIYSTIDDEHYRSTDAL